MAPSLARDATQWPPQHETVYCLCVITFASRPPFFSVFFLAEHTTYTPSHPGADLEFWLAQHQAPIVLICPSTYLPTPIDIVRSASSCDRLPLSVSPSSVLRPSRWPTDSTLFPLLKGPHETPISSSHPPPLCGQRTDLGRIARSQTGFSCRHQLRRLYCSRGHANGRVAGAAVPGLDFGLPPRVELNQFFIQRDGKHTD